METPIAVAAISSGADPARSCDELPSDLAAAPALPVDLAPHFLAASADRLRTIADARALLVSQRDRLVGVTIDGGQTSAVSLYGLYQDVVHSPTAGVGLVFRGLCEDVDPVRRKHHQRNRLRMTLPLALVKAIPAPFHFLFQPRTAWPLPPALVDCDTCVGAGRGVVASAGRFCVRCRSVVRRGRAARHPGEGFAAMQQALRRLEVTAPGRTAPCQCGARGHVEDAFCTKCGRRVSPAF